MGLFDIASSVLTSGLSGGTLGSSQPGGLTKQNVLGASEQPGSSGRPVGAGSELSQSILDGAMSAGR
jgi:hypothetical protein